MAKPPEGPLLALSPPCLPHSRHHQVLPTLASTCLSKQALPLWKTHHPSSELQLHSDLIPAQSLLQFLVLFRARSDPTHFTCPKLRSRNMSLGSPLITPISRPLNMLHLPWKLLCSTISQHPSGLPLNLPYLPFRRPSPIAVFLETSIPGPTLLFPATSPLTQLFFPGKAHSMKESWHSCPDSAAM